MERQLSARSRIRPTWEGMFWFLLAAVLLTQGWYRNIGLLAFLAFFLFGLLVLQGIYIVCWRRGLRYLRVIRRLPATIFAGTPCFVEVELENPNGRQLALRLEDRCDEGQLRWYIPLLRRREKRVLRQAIVLGKRGCHQWKEVRVGTGFPLGLLRRELIVPQKEERIVYPALGQVNLAHLDWMLQVQSQRLAGVRPWHRPWPGAEFEFHGLREYRSGDSPRYVHWRSSARVGKLLVREMEPPATEQVLVVLDAWRPVSQEPAKKSAQLYGPLEAAVSLAASLLVAFNRDPGRQVGLVVFDGQLNIATAQTGTSQIGSLLESLALVQGYSEGPALRWTEQMPSELLRLPVIWITSRSSSQVASDILSTVALIISGQDISALTWYSPPKTQGAASHSA
ncbi:MAG: DUF58 domain-containing protein [Gemmatales bacterium]|nr:DUF58 domain-containing protein [Gemmatales bacterium]